MATTIFPIISCFNKLTISFRGKLHHRGTTSSNQLHINFQKYPSTTSFSPCKGHLAELAMLTLAMVSIAPKMSDAKLLPINP
jgi:hypothetical protein